MEAWQPGPRGTQCGSPRCQTSAQECQLAVCRELPVRLPICSERAMGSQPSQMGFVLSPPDCRLTGTAPIRQILPPPWRGRLWPGGHRHRCLLALPPIPFPLVSLAAELLILGLFQGCQAPQALLFLQVGGLSPLLPSGTGTRRTSLHSEGEPRGQQCMCPRATPSSTGATAQRPAQKMPGSQAWGGETSFSFAFLGNGCKTWAIPLLCSPGSVGRAVL